ncbi:MAG: hypothetical protein JXR78_16620 [Victivallales bacterium]|nr:hypothetical protein [Victivallales bacterium]
MTDAEKALIEINHKLGGIESSMKDMRHALFGNGRPGVTSRLSALEHSHAACRREHEKEEKRKDKLFDWKLATAATVAVALVTGAVELIKIIFNKGA